MSTSSLTAPRRATVRGGRHIGVHVALLIGSIVMLFPFIWQLATSLKTLGEATAVPPAWLPEVFQWRNYARVFETIPFGSQFAITVIETVGRTLGQLLFCSLAAYAFARLEFKGRNLIFGIFLSVLMVPSQLFLLPQYQLMQAFGWLNTIQALVVPGMFSAFGTFLLRQFFATLPKELDEAARLDGCGPLRIYARIMLPLAKPGLIALAVVTAMNAWNDLMWPLVVNTAPSRMTLSAGLSTLQGQMLTDYPVLMAGAVMSCLPLIVVFALMQRQFIQGIATSGLKG